MLKIKETITRDCCQRVDLKKYRGHRKDDSRLLNLQFCIHCGQLWYESSLMDVAGGKETVLLELLV